jgi:hypothetical protein
MHQDRLNRIIAALALLYVAYIAIALSWHRLLDAVRNFRRRDVGLLGFTVPRAHPRPVRPDEELW